MLHKYLSSPFKLRREEDGSNKASSSSSSSSSSSMAVGLGILVHLSSHLHGNIDKYCSNNNNTVLKSADLRLMRVLNQQSPSNAQSCFLKSCFLCSKNLGTDQDIYMYRGDQGFCSEECRKRQIIVDETKELEISTKKMVAAYRRCSGMSSETGALLHDLRRQNKHIPNHKVRAIFL